MFILKKILKWIGIILLVLLLFFILLLILPEKEVVKTIQPRASTQYWEMTEGFKIAYTHLKGADNIYNPPIIYLHGGPGGYVHSSIIKTLTNLTSLGHDIYLYDQRGSGLSDRLNRFSDINFEKHIGDLNEIIEQKIKSEKVILMGQSFGCIIISHYSTRYPEKISKLIFASPGDLAPPRMKNGAYVDLDSLFPIPDSLNFIEPINGFKESSKSILKPKSMVATMGALLLDKKLISDKQMDQILNTMASKFTIGLVCDTQHILAEEGGGGLYAYLATNNDDLPEFRNKTSEVKAPILVLQGQCDYIPYSAAYEYFDLYPNGEYQFIENAGHEIWWEQEDEFVKRIANFLKE